MPSLAWPLLSAKPVLPYATPEAERGFHKDDPESRGNGRVHPVRGAHLHGPARRLGVVLWKDHEAQAGDAFKVDVKFNEGTRPVVLSSLTYREGLVLLCENKEGAKASKAKKQPIERATGGNAKKWAKMQKAR